MKDYRGLRQRPHGGATGLETPSPQLPPRLSRSSCRRPLLQYHRLQHAGRRPSDGVSGNPRPRAAWPVRRHRTGEGFPQPCPYQRFLSQYPPDQPPSDGAFVPRHRRNRVAQKDRRHRRQCQPPMLIRVDRLRRGPSPLQRPAGDPEKWHQASQPRRQMRGLAPSSSFSGRAPSRAPWRRVVLRPCPPEATTAASRTFRAGKPFTACWTR